MKLLLFLLLLPLMALADPVKYADSLNFESNAFGESREIMISLPKSYESSVNSLYPVIFVVRGQLDMLAVIAGINMLDLEVPEFIVVGVSGSGDEFFPGVKGEQSKFSKMLHDEIVPQIEKEYRVAPYNILVGHSAAGKFVSNDWLDRGKDFSAYFAISPELHDGKINARIKSMSDVSMLAKAPVLISSGNEGQRMQSLFDELKSIESLTKVAKLIQFEDQTHMSGRVHTIMAGLRDSFEGWRPARKIESGQLEGLVAHYKGLSTRYGYEVSIPLDTLTRESAFHSASNIEERWQVASDIVEYALSKTSPNVEAFIDIADELVAYDMGEGSKRLMSYVCKYAEKHKRCAK